MEITVSKQKTGDDFYVAAVTIAATLDKVIPVAENISLGAMNTMALTARAEQSARGFRPITDFMQELANDVRRLTGDVNRVALEVSRTSLSEVRAAQSRDKVAEGQKRAGKAEYAASVRQPLAGLEREVQSLRDRLREYLYTLTSLLDEIDQRILAAISFATVARTEAASLGTSGGQFDAMAVDLNNSAEQVRSMVASCRTLLRAHQTASN